MGELAVRCRAGSLSPDQGPAASRQRDKYSLSGQACLPRLRGSPFAAGTYSVIHPITGRTPFGCSSPFSNPSTRHQLCPPHSVRETNGRRWRLGRARPLSDGARTPRAGARHGDRDGAPLRGPRRPAVARAGLAAPMNRHRSPRRLLAPRPRPLGSCGVPLRHAAIPVALDLPPPPALPPFRSHR